MQYILTGKLLSHYDINWPVYKLFVPVPHNRVPPLIFPQFRKQFGRPLAANQLIQKKMADMLTEVCCAYFLQYPSH